MKISVSENEVKFKQSIIIKVIAIVFICLFLYKSILLDKVEASTDILDIIIRIIVAVFFVFIASMICFKTVTINEHGVMSKCLWVKKTLTWDEIKDYGISYLSKGQKGKYWYVLYFANKEQRTKNASKKKLKGNMIKLYVIGDTQYNKIVNSVFHFCMKFTETKPFVAEEKFHLI